MKWRQPLGLFKDAVSEWAADNASSLSAALAFYTLLSLAPLLVLITGIIGLVFGQEAGQGELMNRFGSILGPEGAKTLQGIVSHAQNRFSGIVATVLSIIVLVFSVSGVFYQLQTSLNVVWEVTQESTGGIWGVVRKRLPSFSIIPVIGFLLIVSTAATAVVSAFGHFLGGLFPGVSVLLQVVNFLLSFVVVSVLFALIYKILPDVRVAWRDVWLGSAVTALLFSIGKFAIGLYLGRSSISSTYGAAGSLVVLLLWVYYSSQIFFFGAEFTQIYSNRYGRRITPAPGARPLPDQDPARPTRPSQPTDDGHERGGEAKPPKRKEHAEKRT
jgi:membrane protein